MNYKRIINAVFDIILLVIFGSLAFYIFSTRSFSEMFSDRFSSGFVVGTFLILILVLVNLWSLFRGNSDVITTQSMKGALFILIPFLVIIAFTILFISGWEGGNTSWKVDVSLVFLLVAILGAIIAFKKIK